MKTFFFQFTSESDLNYQCTILPKYIQQLLKKIKPSTKRNISTKNHQFMFPTYKNLTLLEKDESTLKNSIIELTILEKTE